MNTNQRNKKGAKFVVFIKFVLKYLDNFVRQCLEFLRTQPVFDLLKTKMQNLSLLANFVSKHKIDYKKLRKHVLLIYFHCFTILETF